MEAEAERRTVEDDTTIQNALKATEAFKLNGDTELEAAIEYLSCLPVKFKVDIFKKILKSYSALFDAVAEFKADRTRDLERLSADLTAERNRGRAKLTKLGVLQTVYSKMIAETKTAGVSAATIAEAITKYESENGEKFLNKKGVLVTYVYHASDIRDFFAVEKIRRTTVAKTHGKVDDILDW